MIRILIFILFHCSVLQCVNSSPYRNLQYKSARYFNVIDFQKAEEVSRWFSTNDRVMGGESYGELNFSGNSAIFSGNISLANNGGFSSIYRNIDTPLSELGSINIDFLGDGFIYQVRVVTFVDGFRLAYKHDFQTKAGLRDQKNLPLNEFVATFRGRLIESAPLLRSENITQIGFLLNKNEEGPFVLKLFHFGISKGVRYDE